MSKHYSTVIIVLQDVHLLSVALAMPFAGSKVRWTEAIFKFNWTYKQMADSAKNLVLSSAELIVNHSKHVTINEEAISKIADDVRLPCPINLTYFSLATIELTLLTGLTNFPSVE